MDRYHITTLLGARNGRTAEAFDRDHKVLLDAAKGLGFRDFKSFRDRWMGTVDPDGAERNADNQEAAREAYLAQSIDGLWFGRSEERRVGKECVSRCRSRGARYHYKKNIKKQKRIHK